MREGYPGKTTSVTISNKIPSKSWHDIFFAKMMARRHTRIRTCTQELSSDLLLAQGELTRECNLNLDLCTVDTCRQENEDKKGDKIEDENEEENETCQEENGQMQEVRESWFGEEGAGRGMPFFLPLLQDNLHLNRITTPRLLDDNVSFDTTISYNLCR